MRKFYAVASLVGLIPFLVIIYLVSYYVYPKTNDNVGTVSIVTMVVLLTLVIALGGYLIIRTLMSNLTRALDQAVSIAGGDLTQRIPMQEDPEINKLAKSFNKITDELENKIAEVTRSKKQLQTFLFRIGNALSVKQDVDDLLAMVVDTTTQALEARRGAMLLLTKNENRLEVRKTCGFSPEESKLKEMRIGEGMEGMVAEDGKPRFEGNRILCVPLTTTQHTIGVLAVYDKTGGEFSQDEVEVLSDIATQVALALENDRLKVDQEQMFFETLTALASAVEARDPYTRGHAKRVRKYAELLARRLSDEPTLAHTVGCAALVHDIGKISFPDRILKSGEVLTDSDREMIKQHPLIGVKILEPLTSFRDILEPVRHHHERCDGKGYPDQISGNELSLGAKVLQVADVLDAMFSDRSYSTAKNIQRGIEELEKGMNSQFDPEVARAAVKMLREAMQINTVIPGDEKTANAVLLLLSANEEEISAEAK